MGRFHYAHGADCARRGEHRGCCSPFVFLLPVETRMFAEMWRCSGGRVSWLSNEVIS